MLQKISLVISPMESNSSDKGENFSSVSVHISVDVFCVALQ